MRDGSRGRRLLEVVLVAALLAGAAAYLWVPRGLGDLRHDCAIYTSQSYGIVRGEGNVLVVGGKALPGFYPPAYPLAIAAVHALIGPHVQNGVVASHALAVVSLLVLYLLGRRVAGPLAGAIAVLLLLANAPFLDMAHRVLTQTLTIAFVAVAARLALDRVPGRTGSRVLAFALGLVAGLSVFVHNTNIVLAAAVGIHAIGAVRRSGPRGWIEVAWVAAGLGLAAVLVMTTLERQYGSPFLTGYTAWRFPVARNFSLDYVFDPPYPKGLAPWFLVRSLLGRDEVISPAVAVLWIGGTIVAFSARRTRPELWRLASFGLVFTAILYGFFALYYFRSPAYLMPAVPLQVVVGASALGHVAGRWRRGGRVVGVTGAAGALLLVAFSWGETFWVRGVDGYRPYPELGKMVRAGRLLEDDAAIVGVANPLIVERLLVDDTRREYVYLPTVRQSVHFLEIARERLGRQELDAAAVADWADARLAAGTPVYLQLHSPVMDDAIGPLLELTRLFERRFLLTPVAADGYLRVRRRHG